MISCFQSTEEERVGGARMGPYLSCLRNDSVRAGEAELTMI